MRRQPVEPFRRQNRVKWATLDVPVRYPTGTDGIGRRSSCQGTWIVSQYLRPRAAPQYLRRCTTPPAVHHLCTYAMRLPVPPRPRIWLS